MNRIFQKLLSLLAIVGLSSAVAAKAQHTTTPQNSGANLDLIQGHVDIPIIIGSDGTTVPPD